MTKDCEKVWNIHREGGGGRYPPKMGVTSIFKIWFNLLLYAILFILKQKNNAILPRQCLLQIARIFDYYYEILILLIHQSFLFEKNETYIIHSCLWNKLVKGDKISSPLTWVLLTFVSDKNSTKVKTETRLYLLELQNAKE